MKFYFWKFLVVLLVLLYTLPLAAQDAPETLEDLPDRIDLDYMMYLPAGWVFFENLSVITFLESNEAVETVQGGTYALPSLVLFASPYYFPNADTPEQALQEVYEQILEPAGLQLSSMESTTRGGRDVVEASVQDETMDMVIGGIEIRGRQLVYLIATAPGDTGAMETIDAMINSLSGYHQWLDLQENESDPFAQNVYLHMNGKTLQVSVPASWSVADMGTSAIPSLVADYSIANRYSFGNRRELPADAVVLQIRTPTPVSVNGELFDFAEMPLDQAVLWSRYWYELEIPPEAEAVPLEADFPAYALVLDGEITAVLGVIDGVQFVVDHAIRDTPLDDATLEFILQMLPTVEFVWED